MDDFIKYIIWIVIIISFLSSFFKKKQPQKPAPPRDYGDGDSFPAKEQSANTVDKEEYDILKEIEGMFKTDTSQPTKIETAQSRQETQRTESEHVIYSKGNPLESYKIDTSRPTGATTLTASEHTLEDWSKKRDARRKTAQVDASVSKQADAFEKFLRDRDAQKNKFASLISRRLKQPSTLKEYMIMSEVLSKPRALRKR